MTANHWLFFVILSWIVIVFKKREDTGFPPIAWLASPVCAEPNGLWDWWSGNEHTCWNQPAIHRSPTIKAIQFLFWSSAGQVPRSVCLCMLSYCRLSACNVCLRKRCTCVAQLHPVCEHKTSLLVLSVAIPAPRTAAALTLVLRCPWALMVSCWLLGILWLALHTGWWGVTANPVTQTAAAQLIGGD